MKTARQHNASLVGEVQFYPSSLPGGKAGDRPRVPACRFIIDHYCEWLLHAELPASCHSYRVKALLALFEIERVLGFPLGCKVSKVNKLAWREAQACLYAFMSLAWGEATPPSAVPLGKREQSILRRFRNTSLESLELQIYAALRASGHPLAESLLLGVPAGKGFPSHHDHPECVAAKRRQTP